jgi:hypothetical protein
MNNLVVIHTGHAIDLLRVLRLLRLLRDQILQMLDRLLQLCHLSLTRLKLLVSLVQLGLEVVDKALRSGQLVLSVLQPGAGVVKEVRLDIATVIGPRQLVVQLLDPRLQTVGHLKELFVTLLDVLDEAVFGLHLVGVLLQAEALVSTGRGGLLKQGAWVLGIACHERPTQVVGRKLGVTNGSHALTPHCIALVPNGEQIDGDAVEARRVALTELHEGLVGGPLHGVVEVIASIRITVTLGYEYRLFMVVIT